MLTRTALLLSIFPVLLSCKKPLAPVQEFFEISIRFNEDMIDIKTVNDTTEFSLQLNDVIVPVDWYFYTPYTGWLGLISTDDLPDEIEYEPSENISVQALGGDREYTCEIQLRDAPIVNWPVLDPAVDYTFTWSVDIEPEGQMVSLSMMEGWKMEFRSFSLKDDQRSFTIDKKYFKEFTSDSASIYVTLSCSNFWQEGELFVSVNQSASNFDFEFGENDQNQANPFTQTRPVPGNNQLLTSGFYEQRPAYRKPSSR